MRSAQSLNQHDLNQLQHSGWFARLPDDFKNQLMQQAEIKWLEAQECLFRRDDAFDGLYCVLEGALRINSYSETGKEALLAVIEPYSWFGEISLIDGLPRTHDAIAEKNCRLLHISPEVLEQLLQQQPQGWRYLAQLTTHKARLAFDSLEQSVLFPAFKRLVNRLILLAEGFENQPNRRILHLPQEQLASMLALSRQTTNQILKQLELQQLIRVDYREIEILDLPGLKAISQSI